MLDVGVAVKTRKLILERRGLKSRDVACACRGCGVKERGAAFPIAPSSNAFQRRSSSKLQNIRFFHSSPEVPRTTLPNSKPQIVLHPALAAVSQNTEYFGFT
jgi:hypothetical protein